MTKATPLYRRTIAACFAATILSSAVPSVSAAATAIPHDGRHDFDFEIGTWKIDGKRLVRPLSGSTTWTNIAVSTHIVRKVWHGLASLAELEVASPAPHYAGMMLRTYDPQSNEWSIYWADSTDGAMDPALNGNFANGRGTFFARETYQNAAIYVRLVYSAVTATSFHTEQSFSTDGGATWEPNAILNFTREAAQAAAAMPTSAAGNGQHDFDFEFGAWKTHIKRLLHPLSGSTTWIDYDGTSVVHKVWNGRANLGELEIASATSHLEGLSLRLYDPDSRQWSIYWSSSTDGSLGTAMTGRFQNGRGEFYDQESFDGTAIFVRFIFSDITPTSFKLVQSFSADGGTMWEPNWIATFSRSAVS